MDLLVFLCGFFFFVTLCSPQWNGFKPLNISLFPIALTLSFVSRGCWSSSAEGKGFSLASVLPSQALAPLMSSPGFSFYRTLNFPRAQCLWYVLLVWQQTPTELPDSSAPSVRSSNVFCSVLWAWWPEGFVSQELSQVTLWDVSVLRYLWWDIPLWTTFHSILEGEFLGSSSSVTP